MLEVLQQYKQRLINLNQKNRSLKLSKISPNRDFDLFDFSHENNEPAQSLLLDIIKQKPITLIKSTSSRLESTNKLDSRLKQLYRKYRSIFEETGLQDLYVGFPFLEGKFADGNIVRSPLMFFPVKLVKNHKTRGKWSLEPQDSEAPSFNRTLFLAYEKFNDTKLNPEIWEEDTPEKFADFQEFYNQLYKFLKDYNIDLNFPSEVFQEPIVPFADYLQETLKNFKQGALKIVPSAVLSIFPQSDSTLLQDYNDIEAAPENFELEDFFGATPITLNADLPKNPEQENYFVSQVDASQEHAILQAKNSKALVVHGPPGTGKSQMIINLISDYLAQDKTVLLVSQKKAALDVVFKRLESYGIQDFCALVHDFRADRNLIYERIRRQIDQLEKFQNENTQFDLNHSGEQYTLVADALDEYSKLFEQLYQEFIRIRNFGLSAHYLYLHSTPTQDDFALETIAKELNQEALNRFYLKLDELLEYRDLEEESHLWKHRYSFAKSTPNDKQNLLELIEKVKNALPQLIEKVQSSLYQGKYVLENEDLLPVIQRFRMFDEKLQEKDFASDFVNFVNDQAKIKHHLAILSELSLAFEGLEKVRLLKNYSWNTTKKVEDHIATYEQKKGLFKVFDSEYRDATNYLKAILKTKNLELNELSIDILRSELALFKRLDDLILTNIQFKFFEDIPIFSPDDVKHDWIKQKKQNLLIFNDFYSDKTFNDLKPKVKSKAIKQEEWEASLAYLERLESVRSEMEHHLAAWQLLPESHLSVIKSAIIENDESIGEFLDELNKSLNTDFADMRDLDKLKASLLPVEKQLLKKINQKFSQAELENVSTLKKMLQNLVYNHWIKFAEQESPVLLEVSARTMKQKLKHFSAGIDQKQMLTNDILKYKLKQAILDYLEANPSKALKDLLYQVKKKRRIWPMRKLISEFWDLGLNKLTPCWLASPESAAAIFPMQKDFFDIVIFDEASQCYVEKGIPVILRGKQTLIAGDDKQLPPYDLYSVKTEEEEVEQVELEVESLLSLAQNQFPEVKLQWHYRSVNESLINFSNYAFYDANLKMFASTQENTGFLPPIEWISVEGIWEKNTNRVEAERVIDLLLELLVHPEQPTIGVVTFNFFQQQLILDLLDKKMEEMVTENPELYQKLSNELSRTEKGEFVGLFIKNIENVQGDERDVIIFSVAYARNASGVLRMNFGSLNQKGGENRLNVAITRSKKKIYMICSIMPEEMDVEHLQNQGPIILKKYLQYAKAVSDADEFTQKKVLNSLTSALPVIDEDSDLLAEKIYAELERKDYKLLRNYGNTKYKIDIVVCDPVDENRFLMAIECQGSNYFSGISAKEREVYRRKLLESKGWQFHRVWARNYWLDTEKEIEAIVAKLTASE